MSEWVSEGPVNAFRIILLLSFWIGLSKGYNGLLVWTWHEQRTFDTFTIFWDPFFPHLPIVALDSMQFFPGNIKRRCCDSDWALFLFLSFSPIKSEGRSEKTVFGQSLPFFTDTDLFFLLILLHVDTFVSVFAATFISLLELSFVIVTGVC